ncbi:hypothetical protein KIPB_005811 [Kipferlia bialata]|uniref:V-SNARE coiled-coil homology domain-containing protein n=1 Tax=Kipferlia bialata TaxID=797122 RepID=A0A9K3CXV0_9EUKA|nr:hypothetical protein KIPB_005811 [Kipferlia bialata]|eukprot:g5811.t1
MTSVCSTGTPFLVPPSPSSWAQATAFAAIGCVPLCTAVKSYVDSGSGGALVSNVETVTQARSDVADAMAELEFARVERRKVADRYSAYLDALDASIEPILSKLSERERVLRETAQRIDEKLVVGDQQIQAALSDLHTAQATGTALDTGNMGTLQSLRDAASVEIEKRKRQLRSLDLELARTCDISAAEVADLRRQRVQAEEQAKLLKWRVKEACSNREQQTMHIQGSVQLLRDEVSSLQRELLLRQRRANSAVEQQTQSLRAASDQLERELRRRLEQIREQVAQQRVDTEADRQKASELETLTETLKEDVAKVEAEQQESAAVIEAAFHRHTVLSDAVREFTAEVAAHGSSLAREAAENLSSLDRYSCTQVAKLQDTQRHVSRVVDDAEERIGRIRDALLKDRVSYEKQVDEMSNRFVVDRQTYVDQLTSLIAENEVELSRHKAELTRLQRDLEARMSRDEENQRALDRASGALTAARDNATRDHSQVVQTNAKLRDRLLFCEREMKQLKESYATQLAYGQQSGRSLDEMKKLHVELRNTKQRNQTRLEEVAKRFKALRSQLVAEKKEFGRSLRDVKQLSAEMRVEVQKMLANLGTVESEQIALLNRDLETITAQSEADIEAANVAAVEEIDAFNRRAEEEIKGLEDMLRNEDKRYKRQMNDLNERFAALQAERDELERDLYEMEQQPEQTQEDLDQMESLQGEVDRLETLQAEQAKRVLESQDSLTQLGGQTAGLKTQFVEFRHQAEDLARQVEDAMHEMVTVRDTTQMELQQLELQRQALLEKVTSDHEGRAAIAAEIEALAAEKASLTNEIEAAGIQMRKSDTSISDMEREISYYEGEIRVATATAKSAQATADATRKAIDSNVTTAVAAEGSTVVSAAAKAFAGAARDKTPGPSGSSTPSSTGDPYAAARGLAGRLRSGGNRRSRGRVSVAARRRSASTAPTGDK